MTTHLSKEEHTEKFGELCDVVCRIFLAEHYGISDDDGLTHTSEPARAAAAAAISALEDCGVISLSS